MRRAVTARDTPTDRCERMSIAVSTKVWRHSRLKGTSLLILLALADWSDDEGRSFPSIRSLAGKARISERQTQKQLDHLRQLGELEVHLGMGPVSQGGRSNLYRIRLEGYEVGEGASPTSPPVTRDGVSRTTRRGVTGDRKGVSSATPNTSEIRQDTPSGRVFADQTGKPEGVDDSTWRDFMEVLRVKGKAATPTYLASLEAAGKAAGMGMQDVVRTMAAKGWASFDASWVRGAPGQSEDAAIDLATKGGIERAAREQQMQKRADEQWPQFADRVRAAWAERKGITT